MPELAYSATRQQALWREASDRDLLSGVGRSDETALDELIRRKSQALLQLAYRMLGNREEAKDIVQVTFLKIWENGSRFDDRYSPNTWIYRIATNLAIDQLRSRRSRERSHEPVRHHLRGLADNRHRNDGHRLEEREVTAIFAELAKGLSERQRLAFLLREIEGLSSHEVSEVLGCRESTVRNHVFYARKYLQRELRQRYPEYVPERAAREDEP